MSVPSLPQSTPFAFLIPLSTNTVEALRSRTSKRILEKANLYPDLSSNDLSSEMVHSNRGHGFIITLDFTLLFSRRYLSFGASRDNDLVFPSAASAHDVSQRHFILYVEMQMAILLLTDVSDKGTWILDEPRPPKLLHRATYPLLHTTCIGFGQEHRYRLRITVADYMRNLAAFSELFKQYSRTVNQPPPMLISTDMVRPSLLVLDNRFVSLHPIGSGEFEILSSCLRVSDGKLLAIKELHSPKQDSRVTSRQQAQDEIRLLSLAKHPNIIELVDQIEVNQSIFLIMALVPTGTFADMLNNSPSNRIGHLSIQALLRQCLYAIEYLHRHGIIHRSIRPKSLLILSSQPLRLKLCNFGAARSSSFRLTRSSRSSDIDSGFPNNQHFFGVDIWALGVVALNAFGYWPFELPAMDTCASRHNFLSTPPAALPNLQYFPCIALLQGMFRTDCRDRSSAADCLQNPWLRLDHVRRRQGSASIGKLQVAKRRKLAPDAVEDNRTDMGSDTGEGCFTASIETVSSGHSHFPWPGWACDLVTSIFR